MNFKNKILFFVFFPFLLLSSCSDSSRTDGNKNEEINIELDEEYYGEDVYYVVKNALGEFSDMLPVLDFSLYNDVTGKVSIDKTNDIKYVDVLYQVDNYEDAFDSYNLNLKLNSFMLVDGPIYENGVTKYGFKSVSDYQSLTVEYTGYFDREINDNFLLVRSYIYIDKELEWPSDIVKEIVGVDIPTIEANYYNYQIDPSGYEPESIMIIAYGSETLFDEYESILLKEGYKYRYNSSESTNIAYNHEDGIGINFTYDPDIKALLIYVYKLDESQKWPVNKVRELLGEDLPIYDDASIMYEVNELPGTEEYGFIKLQIACMYAPSSSFDAYVEELVNIYGWVEGEMILSSDLSYTGFEYTKNNLKIDVIYFVDVTGTTGNPPALIINIY